MLTQQLVCTGRRWQRHGFPKVTLLNLAMLVLFLCGVHPDNLARLYFS